MPLYNILLILVALSLAAGAGEVVTTWSDLVYMQDMNANICNSATIGDSKQLIDERDGKYYWVTKLKDERCWMTQNLDLDLAIDKTLTPYDTDIVRSWTLTNMDEETIKAPTALSTANWPSSNMVTRSYDPGYNVFVNGITSKPATEDLANGKTSGDFTIEDAHYLQGNYYSFSAATAETGFDTASDGGNASGSICPKGWKLPLSGSGNGLSANTASGSFGKMINSQLGITSTSTADTNLLKDPLYFIRGGDVNNGSFTTAGSYGYYWSSTSYSATDAYCLNFYSSGSNRGVSPSYHYSRYHGLSVRCVAR